MWLQPRPMTLSQQELLMVEQIIGNNNENSSIHYFLQGLLGALKLAKAMLLLTLAY